MTDRELLEKAARSGGYTLNGHTQDERKFCVGGAEWNPLTDDGDALRLFCALPWLCIETSDLAATVCERGKPGEPSRVYLMWPEWLDKHNGDLAAATRRAIVRAAAAMADAQEGGA